MTTYPRPYATQHNGGRLQGNFGDPQAGGDYPYINHVKTSQAVVLGNGFWPDPTSLSDDTYPVSFVSGQGLNYFFFIPSQASRPGNWVCAWDGAGQVALAFTNTGVSMGAHTTVPYPWQTYLYQSDSNGGYVVCTPSVQAITLSVTQGTVTNLRFYHINDEPALNAGEIWTDNFISFASQFGILRFLNWQDGNNTNVTTWATRRRTSCAVYAGTYFPPEIYAGTSTRSGGAYSAALSGFALADKATVTVRFNDNQYATISSITSSGSSTIVGLAGTAGDTTFNVGDSDVWFNNVGNASGATGWAGLIGPYTVTAASGLNVTLSVNSSSFTGSPDLTATGPDSSRGPTLFHANPTLNVNSTGAIPIVTAATGGFVNSDNSRNGDLMIRGVNTSGCWNNLATLVYNATLNVWIKQGSGLYEGNSGVNCGIPYEHMLDLCAKVGAHPHFVMPPQAMDPPTDFAPSLASYCAANGPSWMIPRFEGPNELWNTALGFYQSGYGGSMAGAYHNADPTHWPYASGDYHNWYGKVMSILGQAVAAAYGVTQANAKTQTKYQVLCGVQTFGDTESSDPRLTSAAFVSQTAAAPSGYIKSAANSWVTRVCLAQYFQPAAYNTSRETTDSANWTGGSTGAQAAAIADYVSTCFTGGSYTLDACAGRYAAWKAWAISHGIPGMCGYEGGYSPDTTNGGPNAFRVATKYSPDLGAIVTQNLNAFIAFTDGSFTAEFPSLFMLSNNPISYSGVWDVLNDIYVSPQPNQWLAYVAWNAPVAIVIQKARNLLRRF